MYPKINAERLSGAELIMDENGQTVSNVQDFWRWAYSDIMGNAERGALAEYIVACALGINHSVRTAWDRYDLLTEDGIAVEVKTSGYLQTWEQNSLSRPVFGIQPTYGWNSETNEYDSERRRQADVYVFCLHKHTEQDTINPLMLEQWEFYVLPTSVLNEKFGTQKTVTLSALMKAGAKACTYNELKDMVKNI